MTDDNVEKILKAKPPTTKKTLRSFLGLANYYRDYIPNYASIALPLTEMTKKSKPNVVEFGQKEEEAFEKLKKLICSKPVLQMPNLSNVFILQTDASDHSIGAALLQEHEGKLMPISFASRKLVPRERNYCIMEKECLAVVWAIQKFKVYLYGKEFILQTDHQPLICMNNDKVHNERIFRWSLLLQPFRFRIVVIKGTDNVIADYLSRSEDPEESGI